QLHERLPVRRTRDDFDQLSGIVNAMLDEIERLLSETRGVGEGIAHDMRTPLTRLRARLERALEDPRLTPETGALIAGAIADIDQTLVTIKALLRIAEVEHGARRAAFAVVDLSKIVTDVIELYEPVAAEKNVRLQARSRLQSSPTVIGDTNLLFEALANLIDNAIKFSPAGSSVRVELGLAAEGPFVQVLDSGPGIAREDWGHVTQRFFRSDRSRHTPGSGLGLSLVASIVRLHGFGLILHPAASGCEIELRCWPHPSQTAVQVLDRADRDTSAGLPGASAAAAPIAMVPR
ncbi:MAG TPA: ATP-binding protein, partial [Steroidobacteraceae bacterium]|nr:ATP-binding protein [Steroidobacteraceae bacterium]